ncbi:MAG: hypothetical protein PHW87_10315 [Methanothrix sp.]|nr:hypothetical protein [Methanothrix sp.]
MMQTNSPPPRNATGFNSTSLRARPEGTAPTRTVRCPRVRPYAQAHENAKRAGTQSCCELPKNPG